MKFIRKNIVWVLFVAMIVLWYVTRGNLRQERQQKVALQEQYNDLQGDNADLQELYEDAEIESQYHRVGKEAYRDSFFLATKKYQSLIRYHEKTLEDIYDMPADSAYASLKAWLRAE